MSFNKFARRACTPLPVLVKAKRRWVREKGRQKVEEERGDILLVGREETSNSVIVLTPLLPAMSLSHVAFTPTPNGVTKPVYFLLVFLICNLSFIYCGLYSIYNITLL
jgi:hypothetical protein